MLLKLELLLSHSDGGDSLVFRKGHTMAGFFKILLGGAVGAVLGILFAKKQGAPSLFERSALPPAPAKPVETPVASSATTVTPAPEPAQPAPVVPTYLVPIYYTPQAVAQAPVAAQAPIAAPQASAPTPVQVPVVEPPATPEVAQVAPEPQQPVFQPAPEPVVVAPEPPETPVVEEPAPVAEAAAPPVEEPAPVVEQPVPVFMEPEPPPAPVEEPASAEPVEVPPVEVESDVELESEVDEILAATVGTTGESDSEVVFSPQVLEEPVPGAGWEPSAVFLREDAELDELLPVVPDAVKPYEGAEITEKASIDEDTWLTAGWPEIADAAASESAASVDEELFELEPLSPAEPISPEPAEPTPAPAESITADAESPTEPVVEVPREDDLTSRIEETRRRIAEAAAARAAAPSIEEVWDTEPRAVPEEPSAAEPPIIEAQAEPSAAEPLSPEPVAAAIPEAAVEPVAEPVVQRTAGTAPPAEEPSGDDLKSRIEETRRRIREELEKPFAAVDEPAAPEPAQPVAAAAPSNGGAPAQPAPPAEAPAAGESDFDAMRARIELTRSRLKAKAFDAMMAGESALLGRDEQTPGDASKPAVSIDSEIEQTVDNTLREEDR